MLVSTHEKAKNDVIDINSIESFMLSFPQQECPVAYYFGPGICVREVVLMPGSIAIGHRQKFDHLNIMLTGAVAMLNDDGSVNVLRAPMIFTGKPGRKIGYIIEKTVWQNVYATTETNIEILEQTYLDKSDAWNVNYLDKFKLSKEEKEIDREDFFSMLDEYGFSADLVKSQSENIADQIDLPASYLGRLSVRKSPIDGDGLFLSSTIEASQVIAPARINGKRTVAGRYANHSKNPNAKFVMDECGDIYLTSIRKITGCCGGDFGEEITVDYRESLKVIGFNKREKS